MGIFITVGLTMITIALITLASKGRLENNAKNYRGKQLSDQIFTYATWAKWLEGIGLCLLAFPAVALLTMAEDTYEYTVYSSIVLLLVIALIYRASSWHKEKVMLHGNKVIYSRGKFQKKISTIYLQEIDDVEMRLLAFVIHLKDGKSIKVPACFTELSLLYSILQYYRPEANS